MRKSRTSSSSESGAPFARETSSVPPSLVSQPLTTPLLPPLTAEESSLWSAISSDLAGFHHVRTQLDSGLLRISKVHGKTLDRERNGESFPVKSAVKFMGLYGDTLDKAIFSKDALKRTVEHLELLIAMREATETQGAESKRKKRKTEDIRQKPPPSNVKRAKVHDPSSDTLIYSAGNEIAAKTSPTEWILATIISHIPEKNKYEVEDAVEDDESPGTRKRYSLSSRMIIKIPDEDEIKSGMRPEFPSGATVLALYPASTCFYKAIVVMPPSENVDGDIPGAYVVQFDDDQGFERYVDPRMVLQYHS